MEATVAPYDTLDFLAGTAKSGCNRREFLRRVPLEQFTGVFAWFSTVF